MLPQNWIESIFGHMAAMYGTKFLDMWRGQELSQVKRVWSEKLSGFADKPDAIKGALDALDDKPFPPTLPEFLHLCRDAAKRLPAKTLLLGHQVSDEEIERNRRRIRAIAESFFQRVEA